MILLKQYTSKYLKLKYPHDTEAENLKKTRTLMLTHKDILFGLGSLAVFIASTSLEYFCLYYLQDTFVPKPNNQARTLSPTHYECLGLLDDCLIKDEFQKLILCLPRGFAKSTVATFASVIHQACYGSHFQIVMGKTEADAQNFIFDVRKQLEENEFIKKSFGELINSKRFTVNKNELCLTNGVKILALSSTSSCRGRKHAGKRPTAIYLDDIQGLDDVISDQAKDKKLEIFRKDILFAGDEAVCRDGKRIQAGTKFIILGTVLASDCFVSRLLEDKTYKSIVRRAILVDDIDELFKSEHWERFRLIYYDNKNDYAEIDAKNYYLDNMDAMKFPVLWEDKWDCMELFLKYASDPVSFHQEMMNNPSNANGSRCFFNIKTMQRDEMERFEFDRTMMTIDNAVETGRKNDYTAVCIGSRGKNGFRYIRRGTIFKKDFDDSADEVYRLLKMYPDITHVFIEKNTFQGRFSKALEDRIKADQFFGSRKLTIIENRNMSSKENRIRALSGKVNNGFIVFCGEDEDFYKQILDYQGSKVGHDDAADALEMLDSMIDDIKQPSMLKVIDRSVLGI